MKRSKPVPIFLSLILFSNALAQVKPDLLNASLTEPRRKVAYAGVKNVFTLQGDLPGKQIRIERSGGPLEIKAGTSVRAIARFEKPGRDTLRLFVDEKLILEKPIEILELGAYKAIVRGSQDASIDTEKLLSGERLIAVMPGTWYKPSGRIESYRVTLFGSARSEKSFRVEGAFLPPEIDAEALKGVARIRFDQIRMRKEDGSTSVLDVLEYSINGAAPSIPPAKSH